MPIYEYQCQACDHVFDLRQGFDAVSMSDCPRCGKMAHRRFRPVPIIFKGSGWYVTDYSHKNSTLSDDGPKDSKTETKTETKAESKKEPKAESKVESKTGDSEKAKKK
jgi:putative FmdB family regulatory protein